MKYCFLLSLLVAMGSGCSSKLKPNLSLVEPYSYELEAKEPFDKPFISHFKKGQSQLTYVAAFHENKSGNATFNLIDKALKTYRPKLLILEGFETSLGELPAKILDSFKSSSTKDFYKWGETAYAALRAEKNRIAFIGAEPSEKEIIRGVIELGYKVKDLALFYFVRQVSQFKRGQELAGKRSIASIYDQYIKRTYSRLGIVDQSPPTFGEFLRWFQNKNGKTFSVGRFDNEDTAPLLHGKYFTQRIAHAVGMVRDRYVIKLIAEKLNEIKNVMIVFGKSHLAQQRRSLVSMLGLPKQEYL